MRSISNGRCCGNWDYVGTLGGLHAQEVLSARQSVGTQVRPCKDYDPLKRGGAMWVSRVVWGSG